MPSLAFACLTSQRTELSWRRVATRRDVGFASRIDDQHQRGDAAGAKIHLMDDDRRDVQRKARQQQGGRATVIEPLTGSPLSVGRARANSRLSLASSARNWARRKPPRS